MTTMVYDIKFLTANFLGAVIAALRLNELGIPHFFYLESSTRGHGWIKVSFKVVAKGGSFL